MRRKGIRYIQTILLALMPLLSFSLDIDVITYNTLDTIDNNFDKVNYLIYFANSISGSNPKAAMNILDDAEMLIEQSDSNHYYQINYLKSDLLFQSKEYQAAIQLLSKLLKYYKHNNVISSDLMKKIAMCYMAEENIPKTKLYITSAHDESILSGDTMAIISTLIGYGNYLFLSKDYQSADTCFKTAYKLSHLIENKNFQAEAGYHICKSGIVLNKPNIDSLLAVHCSIIEKTENFMLRISINSLAAEYHIKNGNNEKAATYLQNAISIIDKQHHNSIKDYLSNTFPQIKNEQNQNSTFEIIIWIILSIAFIVILIFLIKLYQKIENQKKSIAKTEHELKAFEQISMISEDEVKSKIQNRLEDIKQEIGENTNTEIALRETIGNLEQVNYLKDMFLSKLSHDIRTPLNGILGFSSLLESELALMEDSTLFEFANNISESGSGLVSLLNNLLDISRLDSDTFNLNIKNYNTNELIQSVIDKYISEASHKNLRLIFDSKSVPDISTDNTIFTKILSLIIHNSVKFTEKGYIKVSNNYDENYRTLNINIIDTGIGIDKAYIKQVFEPYRQESLGYSTNYQGAGLGLPLALKMTEKLGGSISIKSEKGKGTQIKITFPIHTYKEPKKETQKKIQELENIKKSLPWDNRNVLLVEDDNLNQILFRKMLKSTNNLAIARDSKTAFQIIEKMDKENPFDLVLMDINLPGKHDGISLMKEIRKQFPVFKSIPFIAQTAFAISGNREKLLDEGFNEYITKPIIKSTLADVITKVL